MKNGMCLTERVDMGNESSCIVQEKRVGNEKPVMIILGSVWRKWCRVLICGIASWTKAMV